MIAGAQYEIRMYLEEKKKRERGRASNKEVTNKHRKYEKQ